MKNIKFNPFRVLTNPREFVQEAIPKTKKVSIIFAFLLGMSYLFGKAYTFGLGNMYTLSHIIVFCLVISIPDGYVLLHVTSFFL